MASDTQEEKKQSGGGVAEQDRTASWIVLYLTGLICLLLPLVTWTFESFVGVVLLVNAALYLNLGSVVAQSTARRLRYLDPSFPRRNALTLVLVGVLQAAHWLTCSHLFYHTHVKLWLLDTVEVFCLVAYVLYVLVRGRSPQFRLRTAMFFLVVSMLALATATFYKHYTRKSRHVHIRNDWRLLYIGLAQLVHAMLFVFGTRYFQAWFCQALALPFYILIGVCAGHRRLHLEPIW